MGVTIDDTSEYDELFDMGYNTLAGVRKENIIKAVNNMLQKKFILSSPAKKLFGGGDAADKMISIIKREIN